ncbi:MAG: two-component system, OmpR family, sensor kinase [Thermoleophilaceae bacterium]|jgi:signal transduction histidine kinase|nr:two-component system, OmpR family, sensor kinase [Thermoleophilaceae bacterium]MEA2407924.1 two-component system, OmpR family, sensor kinase [Thermoleophilaceae bacterium]
MRTRLPVKLKVAVLSAALTFAILCLFAVVVGAVAEQRIVAGFDDDLRATVAELADRISLEQRGNTTVLSPEDQDVLRAFATGDAVVRVVNTSNRTFWPENDPSVDALGPPISGVTDLGDVRVSSRELVVPGPAPPGGFELIPQPVTIPVGYVQYAKPEGSIQQTVNRVRLFLAFGVLGGTLLAFLGGLLVAKRAMRPIAGLTRAAREVARTRDPDITLPKPQANDEVSELAHTFEDMLRELSAAREETEATLARQRKFVADASHELRTPLTSILANLELLEAELAGEQRDMADSALRSSRRMRRLVGDLLLLARADAGRHVQRAPVDLAALAAEAAGEAGALSSGHPVSLDLPGPVMVNGLDDDLHRLAGNLIENALIHTPAGTPVTVSVRRNGDSAVLEVSDRGPGVPQDMRERVFERFARGAGDATPRGGSGLGLAIVRAVASGHGGSVELRDAEGGGAHFVVTLPAESGTRSDSDASVLVQPGLTPETSKE